MKLLCFVCSILHRVRRVQSNTRFQLLTTWLRDIHSLLPNAHVLSSVCKYSQLFSELWVNRYLHRAVTFTPAVGQKVTVRGAKSNMQVLHGEK